MINKPSPLAQLGGGMQQGNGLQLSGGFRQQNSAPQMGGGFQQRPQGPQMGGGFMQGPQMGGGFQAQSPLAQLGAGMGSQSPQMSGGFMAPQQPQMGGGFQARELQPEGEAQDYGTEMYSRPTFGGALNPNMIPGSPGFGGGQQLMPGGRNPMGAAPQLSGGIQQMPQPSGEYRNGR